MALPFFYLPEFKKGQEFLELGEDTSKHIIQVLRMKKGESVLLTDGKGQILTAGIEQEHKKKTLVKITGFHSTAIATRKIIIGISLIKNTNRFEWFLEKATEIGVSEIVPLICNRTEKSHFRYDRMKTILVSAMLQSQQSWLPALQEPFSFHQTILNFTAEQQFIAHCIEEERQNLTDLIAAKSASQLILIGPEGDFTQEEIDGAVAKRFVPVSLGNSRLRTETAGVVAAALMKNGG
jgi:16S rRNA (uracil1498-N3)-methyltransferase